jgi:hypothetical protein
MKKRSKSPQNKMAFGTNGAMITYKLNIEIPYTLLAN